MKAEVYIENNQDKFELGEELEECIRAVANEAVRYENCNFDAEVDVTIVDNEEICRINNEHRGKNTPTDVLSFPMLEFDGDNEIDAEFDMEDGAVLLGDIVISLERASEQAEEYGHSLKREVGFLTAHSMLHLLGYDHETSDEEAEIMFKKQEDILTNLGITRD